MVTIMAVFGNFMVKLYLNNKFNGLIDLSASEWHNQIPISLFQTSKLDILMIYGFSKPWKPVFTHFIITKCFTKYKKNRGTSQKHIIL